MVYNVVYLIAITIIFIIESAQYFGIGDVASGAINIIALVIAFRK
jgi:hypothetical protein